MSNNPKGRGGFADNPGNINRKGPPLKDNSWQGIMRAACDEMAGKTNLSKKEAIVKVLLQKAVKGDLTAMKMLMDRMEGLCVAKVETKGENTLKIVEEVVE